MRVTRVIALAVVLAVTTASGAASQTLPIRHVAAKGKKQTTHAQQAQQAALSSLRQRIVVLRKRTWTCQAALGETPFRAGQPNVWRLPRSVAYRTWVAERWAGRAKACRGRQAERARQWNWQAFPSWIIQLANCESGGSGGQPPGFPNWWAEGSSSDGTFYSAFNIGRTRYDGAAHHMGVRGWNEGKGVPSPYEQAMALIGYVRLYGDGFTGHCAGIARSSW